MTKVIVSKFNAVIKTYISYTVLRTSVIGVCSMAGRTGSIASAYVGEIVSLLILMASS
jgi:hypothetical protein